MSGRIEAERSSELYDEQLALMFRTSVEINGEADVKMIEENNKLRDEFIELACRLNCTDNFSWCDWLRLGIDDKFSTEELKELANNGRCNLNTDSFYTKAAQYFLARRGDN